MEPGWLSVCYCVCGGGSLGKHAPPPPIPEWNESLPSASLWLFPITPFRLHLIPNTSPALPLAPEIRAEFRPGGITGLVRWLALVRTAMQEGPLPRAACLRSGCCPEACAPAAFQAALVHRHPSPHGWWPQKRLDLQSLQESVVPAALNSKLSHFARVALEWGHAGAPPAPRANPGEQRAPALENSDQQHTVDCGV